MARPNSLTAKKDKKVDYPSAFGSHRSMVREDIESAPGFVVCEDAGGTYTTEEWKLDCGLADVNRYAGRDSWNMAGSK